MVSFERFHQNCQAVLAAVSMNGLTYQWDDVPGTIYTLWYDILLCT